MTAEELINHMIPPLKTTDKGRQALNWMEEFRITQLPEIEEDLSYRGLISENTILESDNLEKSLSEYTLDAEDKYAHMATHFYDVIKLAMKNKMQVVAVVNEEKKFQGVISVNDTTAAIAQMFASQGPGGIIVLSMKENQYSLAEISRLIESNDAKIISSFIVNDELDPSMIKVTLKLNRTDLSRLIATLERYEYKIIAQFQETELITNDKERLDLLLKYLSI
ncbi:MAG: CBS domain-containing protein [Cytophagaceae bacterium]|nr:CBS domain-containing protein [Cytophagaceae bacterium]